MDNNTKRDLLRAYNAAVSRMQECEAIMDVAPINGPKYARASTGHSFALGEQAGISHALGLMGYELIINDVDIAEDISPI